MSEAKTPSTPVTAVVAPPPPSERRRNRRVQLSQPARLRPADSLYAARRARPARCRRVVLCRAQLSRPTVSSMRSVLTTCSSVLRTRSLVLPGCQNRWECSQRGGRGFESPAVHQLCLILFYVHILRSQTTGCYYVGQTEHPDQRLAYHKANYSIVLKNPGPWEQRTEVSSKSS
jgi:hypothetical protein